MIHNNKVYANADEKFVKGTILYTEGIQVYHDREMTKPVLTTELVDLCLNGVVVYDVPNTTYKFPVQFDWGGYNVQILGGDDAVPKKILATKPTE